MEREIMRQRTWVGKERNEEIKMLGKQIEMNQRKTGVITGEGGF